MGLNNVESVNRSIVNNAPEQGKIAFSFESPGANVVRVPEGEIWYVDSVHYGTTSGEIVVGINGSPITGEDRLEYQGAKENNTRTHILGNGEVLLLGYDSLHYLDSPAPLNVNGFGGGSNGLNSYANGAIENRCQPRWDSDNGHYLLGGSTNNQIGAFAPYYNQQWFASPGGSSTGTTVESVDITKGISTAVGHGYDWIYTLNKSDGSNINTYTNWNALGKVSIDDSNVCFVGGRDSNNNYVIGQFPTGLGSPNWTETLNNDNYRYTVEAVGQDAIFYLSDTDGFARILDIDQTYDWTSQPQEPLSDFDVSTYKDNTHYYCFYGSPNGPRGVKINISDGTIAWDVGLSRSHADSDTYVFAKKYDGRLFTVGGQIDASDGTELISDGKQYWPEPSTNEYYTDVAFKTVRDIEGNNNDWIRSLSREETVISGSPRSLRFKPTTSGSKQLGTYAYGGELVALGLVNFNSSPSITLGIRRFTG